MLYNIDAIIAVGYRVNSYEATQFRVWARNVLKEYIVKGFVVDDERLKGKDPFGADYFEELLERILFQMQEALPMRKLRPRHWTNMRSSVEFRTRP